MTCANIVWARIAACGSKLLALLMLSQIVLVNPACAQSQKWDTSYIADDTYYMVGVNVQHLLEYEREDSQLRQQVTQMLKQSLGIEAAELKQFQFLLGGEVAEGEDDDDMLQIKLIFSQPQKFDDLLAKIFGGEVPETAEHKGIKYFPSPSKHSPSAYAPTDKMLVIANESRLFTLMEAEKTMGEFVERIKQADGNADLFLTFNSNDMTNRLVGLMARGMPGLPFDIQEIAAEAKHGSLTVDLADNKPLIATIEAKDKEGAERLKRAADALVALGRTGLPQMRLQLDKQVKNGFGEDDFGAAMKEQIKLAQIGLDHAAAVLEGTTIESQGNQVEIQVTVMGGSVDGARALVQSLFLN